MSSVSQRKLALDTVTAMGVQLFAFVASCFFTFFVPRYISPAEYAAWQLYAVYYSFISLASLGIPEGLLLRFGGADGAFCEGSFMRGHFLWVLVTSGSVALALGGAAFFARGTMRTVPALLAPAAVLRCVFNYTADLFRLSGRISRYAKMAIVDRAAHVLFVALFLATGRTSFVFLAIAEMLGLVLGTMTGARYVPHAYFGRIERADRKPPFATIGAGILVVLSAQAAALPVSGSKLFVRYLVGSQVFAAVSFAFTVAHAIVTFASAAGAALFPSLKRMSVSELPKAYAPMRLGVTFLCAVALFAFLPLALFLRIWLPDYAESVKYLAVLFPMSLYTVRQHLLTDVYSKAMRKEGKLLFLNALFALVVLPVNFFVLWQWGNVLYLLYFVVAEEAFHAYFTEGLIGEAAKRSPRDWAELLLPVGFLAGVAASGIISGAAGGAGGTAGGIVGAVIYPVAFAAYTVINRKKLAMLFRRAFDALRKGGGEPPDPKGKKRNHPKE